MDRLLLALHAASSSNGNVPGTPLTASELGDVDVDAATIAEAVRIAWLTEHRVDVDTDAAVMVYAITPSGARAAADYALLHGEVSAMERALVEERSALDQLYVKEGLTNKEVATSLQRHIKLLHDYNESKDIGQMLMGKLAELEGTVTKELYERFKVALDD